MLTVAYLLAFWVMQVMAQVFFKLGAEYPDKKLLYLVLGNVFGAPSTYFLVLLYKVMESPNLALGIAGGGGFIACQLGLAVLFHSRVTPLQGVGVVALALGMLLMALGNPQQKVS